MQEAEKCHRRSPGRSRLPLPLGHNSHDFSKASYKSNAEVMFAPSYPFSLTQGGGFEPHGILRLSLGGIRIHLPVK